MMLIEKRNINDLKEHPDNVRIHPPKQTAELVKSITQFGTIRPIIVDENNVILCGHGLFKAYQTMGLQEVDVMVKGGLTENQKKKLMLADNKVYTLGIDNFDAIDKMMNELVGDFDIPGYDAETLDSLYGNSSIKDEAEEVVKQEFNIPKVEPSPKQEQIVKSINNSRQEVQDEENNIIYAHNDEEEDNRTYIICPHCGEKIYIEL